MLVIDYLLTLVGVSIAIIQLFPHLIHEVKRRLGWIPIVRLDENDQKSLTGRVALVTGGTRGLGEEVVKYLLGKGCRVVTISSASPDEIARRKKRIEDAVGTNCQLEVASLDFRSMKAVVQFAEELANSDQRLDLLVCNAGLVFEAYTLTSEGFEQRVAINYFSHCLLAKILLPKLIESSKSFGGSLRSRIVFVTSIAHINGSIRWDNFELGLPGWRSMYHGYAATKLAMIMFANRLQRHIESEFNNKHCQVLSVHPGLCQSDSTMGIMKWIFGFNFKVPFLRSIWEGAESIVFTAISPKLEGVGGVYIEDCQVKLSSEYSRNASHQDRLWELTWSILNRFIDEKSSEEKTLVIKHRVNNQNNHS